MIHIFVLFLFGATLGKFQRERKINMVGLSSLCLCLLKADESLSSLGAACRRRLCSGAAEAARTSLGSGSARGMSFADTERTDGEAVLIFQGKFIFPWEV